MKDISDKMGFEPIKSDDLSIRQQTEALDTLGLHFRAYDIGVHSKKEMISGPAEDGRRITTWGLIIDVIRWNRDAPESSPAGLVQSILDQMVQLQQAELDRLQGIPYTGRHPISTYGIEPQMTWAKQVLIAPKPIRLNASVNLHIDRLTCERIHSTHCPRIEIDFRFRQRLQDDRFQRPPKWV